MTHDPISPGEVTDFLIETTRLRMQSRIDGILQRHGGNTKAAVTGPGVGISFLFAQDIVQALDHAATEIKRLRDLQLDGAAQKVEQRD